MKVILEPLRISRGWRNRSDLSPEKVVNRLTDLITVLYLPKCCVSVALYLPKCAICWPNWPVPYIYRNVMHRLTNLPLPYIYRNVVHRLTELTTALYLPKCCASVDRIDHCLISTEMLCIGLPNWPLPYIYRNVVHRLTELTAALYLPKCCASVDRIDRCLISTEKRRKYTKLVIGNFKEKQFKYVRKISYN